MTSVDFDHMENATLLPANVSHVTNQPRTPSLQPSSEPIATETTSLPSTVPVVEERPKPMAVNPFASMDSAIPPQGPPQQQTPLPAPSTSGVTMNGAGEEEFLRISDKCNASKCFRLQWEAELNPRCREKTTFVIGNDVYLFDGFYLLCHDDPPSVPQFSYTRGSVMCKITFIAEDLPRSLRTSSSSRATSDTNDEDQKFRHSLFLLQRFIFHQLLGIQPQHLFMKIFPDPTRATGDPSDICSDYHIIPRFIAVNEQPLLNKADLHAPHRIGFAVGKLLSVHQVLQYLEASSKFTAKDFLMQFEPQQLVDCIVSTRINGQPGAFRVDELIYKEPKEDEEQNSQPNASNNNTPPNVITKDGREVLYLKHRGEGAVHYDGAKSKKKIRHWQELGQFLQLSPIVDTHIEVLNPFECHLTGLRTDIFEVASAMPMVLKYIRHCNLLSSFEESMGFKFQDKALLRQAFTHASYVDVGMQNVNTVEATFSRVRLAHLFENVRFLKRTRNMLYEDENDAFASNKKTAVDHDMRSIAEKHLSSDFKQEFHSRFLCPYERLEFLGDAVLGFLVASSAFLKLPNANEGFLHQTRVDIVNNDNLGKMAHAANFELLLLSAFDLAKLKTETKVKITADCVEALLGALYKDQGIVPCRALLGKLMGLHDAELLELCFLSTEEVEQLAKEYLEIDRENFRQWKKYSETRLSHRRFTAKTEVEIKNTHLWLQALTHASFKAPQIDEDDFVCHDPSYERIEFLGDSVLQLLSSAFLVDAFPHHQEHLLTQARSALVKNIRLATVAREAGYEEFIRLGNEVKKNGNLYVEDVLADTFEATLGAVFLENVGDLSKVKSILEKTLFPLLKEAIRRREWMNPRKVLAHHFEQWNRTSNREIRVSFKKIPPPMTIASEDDKQNSQGHCVALYVENCLVARAMGRTISAAQDAACQKALKLYGLKLHQD